MKVAGRHFLVGTDYRSSSGSDRRSGTLTQVGHLCRNNGEEKGGERHHTGWGWGGGGG